MTREQLPTQRIGVTHKVHIGGMVGYVTANTNEDGELREVFIHGFGALGSSMQGWADTLAILLSMYLQEDGSPRASRAQVCTQAVRAQRGDRQPSDPTMLVRAALRPPMARAAIRR
jgi:hypothetical protein